MKSRIGGWKLCVLHPDSNDLHIRPPIALNVFMRPLRHDMGTLNIPFRPLALKEFPLISSLSSSFWLTLLSPFESSYPS